VMCESAEMIGPAMTVEDIAPPVIGPGFGAACGALTAN
jgi:hypothetical protein